MLKRCGGLHGFSLVQFLQVPNANRIAAARDDGFRGGPRAAHRGDTGRPICDRVAANDLLVRKRVAAGGRVNYQAQTTGLH